VRLEGLLLLCALSIVGFMLTHKMAYDDMNNADRKYRGMVCSGAWDNYKNWSEADLNCTTMPETTGRFWENYHPPGETYRIDNNAN